MSKKIFSAVIFLVFIIPFFICACKSNPTNPYKNDMNIDPAVLARIDTPNYTIIRWIDSIVDFGTVKENDTVSANFRFENIGSTPLLIFSVRTSCGCTSASYNKEPIMQGEVDTITIKFDTHNRIGEANKSISVIANTKNNQFHHLELKGKVIAANEK